MCQPSVKISFLTLISRENKLKKKKKAYATPITKQFKTAWTVFLSPTGTAILAVILILPHKTKPGTCCFFILLFS